ncbi:vitellogenin-1-like [Pelobates cultripes]|uniref:Vitellogenin-1-like n=1 Tax=Pelobates cultripes TaxID=61616 RepID=A0AAD1SSP8_PELCU|nr:vitellogenin-1-like [Pelobates cultripes]
MVLASYFSRQAVSHKNSPLPASAKSDPPLLQVPPWHPTPHQVSSRKPNSIDSIMPPDAHSHRGRHLPRLVGGAERTRPRIRMTPRAPPHRSRHIVETLNNTNSTSSESSIEASGDSSANLTSEQKSENTTKLTPHKAQEDNHHQCGHKLKCLCGRDKTCKCHQCCHEQRKAKGHHNCEHELEKIHHEKEEIKHTKKKLYKEKKNIKHKKQKIQCEEWHVRQEKRHIQHEKQGIRHEKQDIQHEKQGIQHEKQNIQHEKQGIRREKQDIQHEKQGIQHEKQNIQHEKQGIQHEKQHIQHEKQDIQHEKQHIQHEKQDIQHEKQHIQHEKQKVKHEREKIEQEKQEIQKEKENIEQEKKGNAKQHMKRNKHRSSMGQTADIGSSSKSQRERVDSSCSQSQNKNMESSSSSQSNSQYIDGTSSSCQSKHMSGQRDGYQSEHVDSSSSSHARQNRNSRKSRTSTHRHDSGHDFRHVEKCHKTYADNNSTTFENILGMNIDEAQFTLTPGHLQRYLGTADHTEFIFILRAFLNDNTHRGYQTTAYVDPVKQHAQLVTVTLEKKSLWKSCINAAVSETDKALAVVRWGHECKDYKVSVEASTGELAGNPAIQLSWQWSKVPTWLRQASQRAMVFIPGMAYMLGVSTISSKNPSRQLIVRVAATSPETVETVVKAPEITFYKHAIPVPFDLKYVFSMIHQKRWDRLPEVTAMITRREEVACEVSDEHFVTFDKMSMNCSPSATKCYTVLAQDCTNRLRFLIAMKRMGHSPGINVKLGSLDITIYSEASEDLNILLNGSMLLFQNNTYTHGKDDVRIYKSSTIVIIKAPKNGVEQVSFNGKIAKIVISPWMIGKTCGLCGYADGDEINNFQKPNQQIAQDCGSLVHSWTLSDNSCFGSCALDRQYVLLENQMIDEDPYTCYSTEPVLKCVSGCHPMGTAPVKIAFHCLPTESGIQLIDWINSPKDESEDLIEEVEAHTSCVCTSQCTN